LFEVVKIMNQEFQNCHENFIQKNPWIFETEIADKVEEKKTWRYHEKYYYV